MEDKRLIIVRIDNEMDNEVYFVANNLPEFLGMIYRNEDTQGTPMMG